MQKGYQLLLLGLIFGCSLLTAQEVVHIDESFSSKHVTPYFFRDSSKSIQMNDVIDGKYDAYWVEAENPYITFGKAPSDWWMKFSLYNPTNRPSTVIISFNRRNFDALELWRKDSTQASLVGKVGVIHHDPDVYFLSNGYFLVVTLKPGRNDFVSKCSNKVGNLYIVTTVFSMSEYSLYNRENVLIFGTFMGLVILSIFFSLLFWFIYRNNVYFLYIIYVGSIYLREAYNFAFFITLDSSALRHCISFIIVGSFGWFLRYFVRLWEINKVTDTIVKYYLVLVLSMAPVYILLVYLEQYFWVKYLLYVEVLSNLFWIVFIVFFTFQHFRSNLRARIIIIAYAPLAIAFFLNLMRNLNLIPNFMILQYAIMIGFMVEMLVFIIAFISWYRFLELERIELKLKLKSEQQKRVYAVQSAEEKIREQIARDLHDDIAASMSGIRILSKVASEKHGKDHPMASSLLMQIGSSAQQTIENISDMIWTLRPHSNYMNDLADRMREYANKNLEKSNIDYQIHIPRDLSPAPLNVEMRRNIYLIYKEALNNVIKHSDARTLEISLIADERKVTMMVADDGHGFNQNDSSKGIGTGLVTMQKLSQDIGAVLTTETKKGGGTKIYVTLNWEPEIVSTI